jgi:hypothetical protein
MEALENMVLAKVYLQGYRKEIEVAFMDYSIGDSYLALGTHEDAISTYCKVHEIFNLAHMKGNTTIASIHIILVDLHRRTRRFQEAKTHYKKHIEFH